jgi:hypothetical protein
VVGDVQGSVYIYALLLAELLLVVEKTFLSNKIKLINDCCWRNHISVVVFKLKLHLAV